jgi:hypothetical protein
MSCRVRAPRRKRDSKEVSGKEYKDKNKRGA